MIKFKDFSEIYRRAKQGCQDSKCRLEALGVVTERHFDDSADYVETDGGRKSRVERIYFNDEEENDKKE